jgi:IclR family KDG regulon transcriptional repressor
MESKRIRVYRAQKELRNIDGQPESDLSIKINRFEMKTRAIKEVDFMSTALKTNEKTEPGLRTVQRALDILYCFTLEQRELTLTEIANKINLAKSTTTRLLSTLEQNNLVQKDPHTLKYRLGQGLYYLGYIAGKSIAVKEIAKPFMKRLRDETQETVNLYILDNESRVCIEQYEGLQSVRHMVNIGEHLPLWAGAGGKLLLAYQSTDFQNHILKKVPSDARRESLQKELSEIRLAQCASSIDEREVGSAAVAAPIFNINEEVKACLSISGPTIRFTPETIDKFKELVKKEAGEISRQLGYRRREVQP